MESINLTEWIGYDQYVTDSRYIIAIDPGHGGVINGQYQTAPAKMQEYDDFSFYEGEFNRNVANYLSKLLMSSETSHFFTTTSNYDANLTLRVTRANNMRRRYPDKKQIFLSIHANAAPEGAESASGIEVFTSVGDTKSDLMATAIYDELENMGWKMRSDMIDGDPDKEEPFYVLRYTKSPAILVELGFYTNREQAMEMMKKETQLELANLLYRAIMKITKNKQYVQD